MVLPSGARPGIYALVVLATMLGAGAYRLRRDGLFSCPASGYPSGRYLAYCQATRYADYDYGAFWFDLEPQASRAATNAQVLFLGNSRMQFGLSSAAMSGWFSSRSVSYYLLGFAYNGNYAFEGPLLRRLKPQAKVYVLSIHLFFEDSLTPPAKAVLQDSSARPKYERKRLMQRAHRVVCGNLPVFCGDELGFFRSRATGAWVVRGGRLTGGPVSYVDSVDQHVVRAYTTAGRGFLSDLPVDRACVLLTVIPTDSTTSGTARAIAAALGVSLVAPELEGLRTFDGSHLDQQSAERWSAALMEAAGPKILKCLE